MKKLIIAILLAFTSAFATFADNPTPDFQDFAHKSGVIYSYISPELVSSMPNDNYSLQEYGWFRQGKMSIESVMMEAGSELAKKLLNQTDKLINRDKLSIMATKTTGPDSSYTIYGRKGENSATMSVLLFIETRSKSDQSYIKVVSLKGDIILRSIY